MISFTICCNLHHVGEGATLVGHGTRYKAGCRLEGLKMHKKTIHPPRGVQGANITEDCGPSPTPVK